MAATRTKAWSDSRDELTTAGQGSLAPAVCRWAGVTAGAGWEVMRRVSRHVSLLQMLPRTMAEHMQMDTLSSEKEPGASHLENESNDSIVY